MQFAFSDVFIQSTEISISDWGDGGWCILDFPWISAKKSGKV